MNTSLRSNTNALQCSDERDELEIRKLFFFDGRIGPQFVKLHAGGNECFSSGGVARMSGQHVVGSQ